MYRLKKLLGANYASYFSKRLRRVIIKRFSKINSSKEPTDRFIRACKTQNYYNKLYGNKAKFFTVS